MKTNILFTTIALVVMLLYTAQATAFTGTGSGTELDPYVVTTVQQLQEVNDELGAHYVLGNNINATETASWNSGEGFNPIVGTFTGVFDGAGYVITDLTINRPDEYSVGLFGNTSGATLQNISLENMDITGDFRVGGLVGYAGGSSITNCYSTGNVTGNNTTGGLVGVSVSSSITNCYSTGTVTGEAHNIGGLIGLINYGRHHKLLQYMRRDRP